MAAFLAGLARDDLAPATLRGYRYDLGHFLAWHRSVQDNAFAIEGLAEYELIAYRQHMAAAGRRLATVNRRLEALRRLCRWARGTGVLAADAARDVRPMRTVRNQQTAGLTDIEGSCVVALCWRLLARPCRQKLRAGPTHTAGGTTCR
jgi:site-specific recombinase XerD